MKSSKSICFAFYEKVDKKTIEPLLYSLQKQHGIQTVCLKGFSYDHFISKRPNPSEALVSCRLSQNLKPSQSKHKRDNLFHFLMQEKLSSVEMRVLVTQLMKDQAKFKSVLESNSPDLVIIPEDIRALHGRLGARIAQEHRIPTLVVSPLYYEWIAARPMMSTGIADAWVCTSSFHRSQLRKYRIPSKRLLCLNNPARLSHSRKATVSFITKKLKYQKFYLATLQNNNLQPLFLSLLQKSFSQIPDKTIIVKFHPSTDLKSRKSTERKWKSPNMIFTHKDNLKQLMQHTEALITISSNTALLAVQKRKPVIKPKPEVKKEPEKPQDESKKDPQTIWPEDPFKENNGIERSPVGPDIAADYQDAHVVQD